MFDEAPLSRSRYQVITTLGQGGMARVLLTMSRGPAGVTKLLVVKELKDELKGDPEFVTMFLDEARIAARLNHPNVIQTYEVSNDGAHPIIVMEYLEGQSLSAMLGRVGRKNMPLELHVYALSQTCAGLHYAHELKSFDGDPLGLVHRDVSPHNVFVTYDGRVLLVDFGIAKAADSAGMTRAGTFKGKLGYAAPEQLHPGATVDRRADLFALGVMLWEALAQRRLTFGEAEGAVIQRRSTGGDPKIREIVPDAPEELARICDKAMARAPEDRFQTAAEVRAALDAWLATTKRAGGEEIGQKLRETFAADREKVRALVEAQMKALRMTTTSGELPAPTLVSESSQSRPGPDTGREPSDSTMKVTAASAASMVTRPGEGSRGRMIAGAGIAVAGAVLAFVLLRGGGAPAATAPGNGALTAPTPAATVEVYIKAEPSTARITLDDAALGDNPFHGAMARSGLARRLRVTAPGFAPDDRLVTLDRDLHLEMALRPAADPATTAPAPVATAPAAPLPGVPQPGVGTRPGPAPQGKTAATSAAGAAPGEVVAPQPPKKSTRSIDETF